MKRSDKAEAWPGFWCMPWGKVDEGELLRETAIREVQEEVGVIVDICDIQREVIVAEKTIQWTKILYFATVENYQNTPIILEPDLATDLAWFPITELPSPIIPNNVIALQALESWVGYVEMAS